MRTGCSREGDSPVCSRAKPRVFVDLPLGAGGMGEVCRAMHKKKADPVLPRSAPKRSAVA